MEYCVHMISKDSCGICNPSEHEPPSAPHHQRIHTIHGASVISAEELKKYGYVVVNTKRDHFSFKELNDSTTMVHIRGHLFLWAVKEILERAPSLETIRVIPTCEKKVKDSHRRLCQKRNVRIILGYAMPQLAWSKGEVRSPTYRIRQSFFLGLQEEQKRLFEELLSLGFEAALMTSRYFCLEGEEYLSQRCLCAEFGFSETSHQHVSNNIQAVMHYLDPSFEVRGSAEDMARVIKAKVTRLREILQFDKQRNEIAEEFLAGHGVSSLASNFPLVRIEVFSKILEAKKNGTLDLLRAENPKSYEALSLRFGLDQLSRGVYRTLRQVSIITDVTGERVRQREAEALAFLGIISVTAGHPTKLVPVDDA